MRQYPEILENNRHIIHFYKSQFSIRVNCPHFLYKEDSNYEIILQYLDYLGIIMFVLQIILFAKYIIQTTAETIALYKKAISQ